MLISVCIPVHNRTYDLRTAMPLVVQAANFSPPVEIVVIDYNSQDDLREYMKWLLSVYLEEGNSITYKRYTGRDHYHMAHARNLSVLASSGEYFVISSADIYFATNFFSVVRDTLSMCDCDWLYDYKYKGVIVCRKKDFVDAGGYDERFEFYSPEDRDLHDRLIRRGLREFALRGDLVSVIPTPNDEKVKNYRLSISKQEMAERMHPIYRENVAKGVLVANPEGWGKW